MKLLSESNPKTAKGRALGYRTAALMLAPHDIALPGKTVCPFSTPGCRESCLYSAGRGVTGPVVRARVNRTLFYHRDREGFLRQLREEIRSFVLSCRRSGHTPAVRLNCLSDLPVESWGVIQLFDTVQFYDYTKNPERMKSYLRGKLPPNYHLTFSYSESTPASLFERILESGGNIAVVADVKPVIGWERSAGRKWPHWTGRMVEGDQHDLTFLYPPDKHGRGNILILRPKGRARHDTTGFVVRG